MAVILCADTPHVTEDSIMDVSVSSTYPAGPVSAQPQDSTKVEMQEAPAAAARADTVKLSQSAQIHAMRQQGQAASQIASSMGVSVASVNSVLGIVVPTQVAAVAVKAAATPVMAVPVAKS
jgi:hypothetical protein